MIGLKLHALSKDRTEWTKPCLSMSADEFRAIPSNPADRSDYLQELLESRTEIRVAEGTVSFRPEDVVTYNTTTNLNLVPGGNICLAPESTICPV